MKELLNKFAWLCALLASSHPLICALIPIVTGASVTAAVLTNRTNTGWILTGGWITIAVVSTYLYVISNYVFQQEKSLSRRVWRYLVVCISIGLMCYSTWIYLNKDELVLREPKLEQGYIPI